MVSKSDQKGSTSQSGSKTFGCPFPSSSAGPSESNTSTVSASGMQQVSQQNGQSFLNLFWQLSSTDTTARLQAARDLILTLRSDQQTFQAAFPLQSSTDLSSTDAEDQAEKKISWSQLLEQVKQQSKQDFTFLASQDTLLEQSSSNQGASESSSGLVATSLSTGTKSLLDDLCCPSLAYTLKRLIRGLPSDRECARLGFATALTQCLLEFPWLPIGLVLRFVLQYCVLGVSEGPRNATARNAVMFARIFAILAIHTAISQATSNNDSSVSKEDIFTENEPFLQWMLRQLYLISIQREFFEDLCCKLIMDICHQHGSMSSDASNDSLKSNRLIEFLVGMPDYEPTTSACHYAMHLQLMMSSQERLTQIPVLLFGPDAQSSASSAMTDSSMTIESDGNDVSLIDLMLNCQMSASSSATNKKASNNTMLELPGLWAVVVESIVASAKDNNLFVEMFWKQVIEERLLSSSDASNPRQSANHSMHRCLALAVAAQLLSTAFISNAESQLQMIFNSRPFCEALVDAMQESRTSHAYRVAEAFIASCLHLITAVLLHRQQQRKSSADLRNVDIRVLDGIPTVHGGTQVSCSFSQTGIFTAAVIIG